MLVISYLQGKHEDVVKACTEALVDDPKYVKVIHRRIVSNETINTWSSLIAAQKGLQMCPHPREKLTFR